MFESRRPPIHRVHRVLSLAAAAVALFIAGALVAHDDAHAGKYPDGLYAEMTTNRGLIVLKLEFEKTPLTVTNFVGLAEGKLKNGAQPKGAPYYDGLVFHRVLDDFMIQGGDPDGRGTGGPGYQFRDEIDESLTHFRPGTLSMANAGRGTNGSQFFITHKATPWLDGKHTVFGYVIRGQDVVNAIAKGDRIEHLKIVRVGAAAEAFTTEQADFDAWKSGKRKREGSVERSTKKRFIEPTRNGKTKDRFAAQFADATEGPDGLRYLITSAGEGERAVANGDSIRLRYVAYLHESGKEFGNWATLGEELTVKVGQGRRLKGLELGVVGMKKGEKRTLFVPAALGLGKKGVPGLVPPNAALAFEIELTSFDN